MTVLYHDKLAQLLLQYHYCRYVLEVPNRMFGLDPSPTKTETSDSSKLHGVAFLDSRRCENHKSHTEVVNSVLTTCDDVIRPVVGKNGL